MSDDVLKDDEARAGDSPDAARQPSTRRGFFVIGSWVLGAIVGTGPALIGLVAFLDPLWRTPAKPKLHGEGASDDDGQFIRVASIDALAVGVPQRFLVIGDQIDAWNFTPDQPIGAVYIEKLTDTTVRVFNTTCPHLGCSVASNGTEYRCPCHNSSFQLDGTKRDSAGQTNPSPRDLDSLAYKIGTDGSILVEFKNFRTGESEKKEKA
jgi:menaquinol-cytochrome c reductase iron-sulfur subunit